MVVSAVAVMVIVVFGVDKGSFMLLLPLGPTVDLSFFLDSGPSGTGIFAACVLSVCTICVFCSFGGSFLVPVPGRVLFLAPTGLLYRDESSWWRVRQTRRHLVDVRSWPGYDVIVYPGVRYIHVRSCRLTWAI